jgi:hypothetical protein
VILSAMIAASVAAQSAPAPVLKSSPAPAAEKKIACCEMMAMGQPCCCCKDMSGESLSKDAGNPKADDGKGHAH